VKINYINFNKKLEDKFGSLIDDVFSTIIKKLQLINELECNLFLTSGCKIKKVNKLNRGINKKTDVLSFPALNLEIENLSATLIKENFPTDIIRDTGNLNLGDIMLCYSVVKKQAKKYNNTIEREMAYMVVHSILHLLGYNHDNDDNKKQMRIEEEEVLAQVGLQRSE